MLPIGTEARPSASSSHQTQKWVGFAVGRGVEGEGRKGAGKVAGQSCHYVPVKGLALVLLPECDTTVDVAWIRVEHASVVVLGRVHRGVVEDGGVFIHPHFRNPVQVVRLGLFCFVCINDVIFTREIARAHMSA